jgi:hypothetical protein
MTRNPILNGRSDARCAWREDISGHVADVLNLR